MKGCGSTRQRRGPQRFRRLYNATGDYDRALVELNEALRLFPQYLYAYKNRGVTYEHKGELAAALADFRVALSYDPNKRELGGKEAAEGIARVEIAACGSPWTNNGRRRAGQRVVACGSAGTPRRSSSATTSTTACSRCRRR